MVNWSPFDPEADRRLVMGLHQGDEDALATLYDLYVERLYDYCVSLTEEPKAAADIVHDTFIDASRRAPRMRNRERLRSWLYAAARRRCLLRARNRGRALHWDWSDGKAGGSDPDSGLPLSELREALESMLARLDFSDQELLLLALRHDVTGEDLAAVLGVPARRANSQAARAWSLAESVISSDVLTRCSRRPGVQASGGGAEPAPDDLAAHAATCPECLLRTEMSVAALLKVPPAPVVPAGLRHRVMHTGTDSELAGYRADIAARGGHLNPDGMPRQPDVPSPIARRWIFTAGGVAGALVSALVAAFIMGPSLPDSRIEWPWQRHPSIEGGSPSKGQRVRPPVRPPQADGGQTGPAGPVVPQLDGHEAATATPPAPTATPGAGAGTPLLGQLTVGPPQLSLELGKPAYVELAASKGPVTWSATSSTGQLELATLQGTIPKDGTYKLKISVKRLLVQLPGQAVVTFTSSAGQPQNIQVTWGLSLLHS
ncbi:RNA polymerase sigma factor [Actinomadura scrupuli]|uniref:RNA polymerase sigma factor n=1 Tax=Actinomadura scrupuli TaxID=559629 RepID=UPI003D97CBC6